MPFFEPYSQEIRAHLYELKISSYRGNDDEPWRNIRLARVAERLTQFGTLAMHLDQIHDHKGTLFYRFNDTVTPREMKDLHILMQLAWNEEGEDGSGIEDMIDLTYEPHPQVTFPFVSHLLPDLRG